MGLRIMSKGGARRNGLSPLVVWSLFSSAANRRSQISAQHVGKVLLVDRDAGAAHRGAQGAAVAQAIGRERYGVSPAGDRLAVDVRGETPVRRAVSVSNVSVNARSLPAEVALHPQRAAAAVQ